MKLNQHSKIKNISFATVTFFPENSLDTRVYRNCCLAAVVTSSSLPQYRRVSREGGGGGGALVPPPTWKKLPLRNVQKKRESSARYVGKKECARSAQIR